MDELIRLLLSPELVANGGLLLAIALVYLRYREGTATREPRSGGVQVAGALVSDEHARSIVKSLDRFSDSVNRLEPAIRASEQATTASTEETRRLQNQVQYLSMELTRSTRGERP